MRIKRAFHWGNENSPTKADVSRLLGVNERFVVDINHETGYGDPGSTGVAKRGEMWFATLDLAPYAVFGTPGKRAQIEALDRVSTARLSKAVGFFPSAETARNYVRKNFPDPCGACRGRGGKRRIHAYSRVEGDFTYVSEACPECGMI